MFRGPLELRECRWFLGALFGPGARLYLGDLSVQQLRSVPESPTALGFPEVQTVRCLLSDRALQDRPGAR